MLQFLTLIPTAIELIKNSTELFSTAKDAVNEVTGSETMASTPEELAEEIQQMPPEQQQVWLQSIQKELEVYGKQNERLNLEQGEISEALLEKVSTEAADKIAVLRQSTRPRIVMYMTHFILSPVYLGTVDVIQFLLHTWIAKPLELGVEPFETFKYVFGTKDVDALTKLTEGFIGIPTTMFGHLYMETVPYASAIGLAYMGLRQMDKRKERSTDSGAVLSNIPGMFKRLLKK